MKYYIAQNKKHSLEKSFLKVFEACSISVETIELPEEHKQVGGMLVDLEPGVVILPSVWEDLFCVKVIQQALVAPNVFECVVAGKVSDAAELACAFNSGAAGFLSSGVEVPDAKVVLGRAAERVVCRLEKCRKDAFAKNKQQDHAVPDEEINYLLRAFYDVLAAKGPFYARQVRLLLVTSSSAQVSNVLQVLKNSGIEVDMVSDIAQAMEKVKAHEYRIIVSDSVLADGHVHEFTENVRQTISVQMPYFVVITSSVEKIDELLEPANHIDEVMLKSVLSASPERILLPVAASVYQVM